jgi:serine/threonine protein kinase/tetratricopeptide (TPR) repeat protein
MLALRKEKVEALMSPSSTDSSVERQRESLAARLADELARLWRQGDCRPVEDFLRLHQLEAQPDIVVGLIYEEMCLRRERGEATAPEEYLRRFPHWRREVEMLLLCDDLLEPRRAPPRFPEVGESLGDFELLAELGRGLHGRVFLATQPALAGRPVVLKLTPRTGHEHLALARLQHTHILPLLFVHDEPARGLFLLCMPYFGGASLAQILEGTPERKVRSGRQLLERVDAGQAAAPVSWRVRGPARQFLHGASAARAVCWVGACLADALHYAHEQGLVHLDVKPSNVLLTADGQPMLLDFHLAREPLSAEGLPPAWLGGTPAYLSPEQQAALAAVRTGGKVPAAVDGRSDVYSLGLLLYELLGGVVPPTGKHVPLHRVNAAVPVGLSDVIAKCLAPEPRQRYASAAALAADLRRHLADLPLEGVRNRSLRERWHKWRRRQPHRLTVWGLLAAVLAATAAATVLLALHLGRQREAVRGALAEGQQRLQQHQYPEALTALRHGQALLETLPGSGDLAGTLTEQIHRAEQGRAAHELHQLADHIRFLYGVEFLPRPRLRLLEARCRDLWDRREEIAGRLQSDLEPQATQQTQADLLDLAILWTDLHVRLAPVGQIPAARQEALNVLDRAEALFGPSPVLVRERQLHAGALGMAELASAMDRRAAELQPRTAWEHYALGRSLLRRGRLDEADHHFLRALDLEPGGLWPNFYRGLCAHRRGRYPEAVIAFSACAILAPDSAGVLFNRAVALGALGANEQALRDYDRALRLDPTLAPAELNRGLLHFREHRYAEAIGDLERALEHGAEPAAVHYNLALVRLAQKDRVGALASVRRAVQADPQQPAARQLLESLELPQ